MRKNKILMSITAAALVFSMVGCGQDKYTAKMIEANKYLASGNYEQAIEAFKAAIDIDPKKTDAYFQLAKAYIGDVNYVQAVTAYDDILAIDATNADAVIGKADALIDSDKTADALKVLDDSAAKTNNQKITDKINQVKAGMHGVSTVYNLNLNISGLVDAIQKVYLSYGCPLMDKPSAGGAIASQHMKIKSPVDPADTGGDWCDVTSNGYSIILEGDQSYYIYDGTASDGNTGTAFSASGIQYETRDVHDYADVGLQINLGSSGITIIIVNDGYDMELALDNDGTLLNIYSTGGLGMELGLSKDVRLYNMYNVDGNYTDKDAERAAKAAQKNLPTYIEGIRAGLNAFGINLEDYLNTSELTKMVNG